MAVEVLLRDLRDNEGSLEVFVVELLLGELTDSESCEESDSLGSIFTTFSYKFNNTRIKNMLKENCIFF